MVVTANRIIRDPKLELESSRFTFDLVPLSYESVDVVVGENWLLRHKAEMVCHEKVVKMPWSIKEDECVYVMSFVVCDPSKVFIQDLVGFTPHRRIGFRMELVQGATPICEGSCRLTSLERQEVWNDCRSYKVRVGSNGNLLVGENICIAWVHGDDVAKTIFRMRNGHVEVYGYAFWTLSLIRPDVLRREYGVEREMIVESLKEEKMYVKFFQQRGSGAKRKQGFGSMLGKREKVIACTSRQLKVLMKDCMANVFDFEAKYHLGKANVDVVPWSRKKE
ncbi:hypothetical protein Tco_1335629 [Tanacetum coccineum]